MGFKVVLAALLLTGVFAGTGVADPNDKPLKDQEKAERKADAVSVPEPSVLLLTAIGMGSLVAFGYWRDRGIRRSGR